MALGSGEVPGGLAPPEPSPRRPGLPLPVCPAASLAADLCTASDPGLFAPEPLSVSRSRAPARPRVCGSPCGFFPHSVPASSFKHPEPL